MVDGRKKRTERNGPVSKTIVQVENFDSKGGVSFYFEYKYKYLYIIVF